MITMTALIIQALCVLAMVLISIRSVRIVVKL